MKNILVNCRGVPTNCDASLPTCDGGGLKTRVHNSCRGVRLELGVTDRTTTSKVGSITGVEEDPRFAFIAKALYSTTDMERTFNSDNPTAIQLYYSSH